MKARLGAGLFGFGVLCAALAAGLAFYVAPAVTKLPPDLAQCAGPADEDCIRPAVVQADNAQFVQVNADAKPPIAVRKGDLVSTTEVVPRPDLTARLPKDLRETAVVWDVYGTVKWAETGETIQQSVTEVALDRVTGAAVNWDKQSLQDAGPTAPSKVAFSGQMYKFPFHTEKRTYDYFDVDLRTDLPIDYQATELVRGLETYRFHQTISERDAPSSADKINALLDTFAPAATGGRMKYSNSRTIWVEPVSGSVVRIEEQRALLLVPDQGSPTALLEGTFGFTDATLRSNVASAGKTRSQLLFIGRQVPMGLAAFGLLLLIGGLLLVTSRRRQSPTPTADGEAGPSEPAGTTEPTGTNTDQAGTKADGTGTKAEDDRIAAMSSRHGKRDG